MIKVIVTILVLILSRIFADQPTELSLDRPVRSVVPRGETRVFCWPNDYNYFSSNYLSIFTQQHSIYVGTIGKSEDEFNWHAVKGKSTDDFHSNLKYLIFKVIDESKLTNIFIHDLSSSFIRDIFSSCPSPIFSNNKFVCKMTFSPIGQSCVSVSSDPSKDLSVIISSKVEVNINYLWILLAGTVILYFANEFSKSEIFQYSFGPIFFIFSGTFVIFLFILSHFQESRMKYITSNVTTLLVLFSSYTAGVIFIIRTYFYDILIMYWEFALFYSISMFLIGLGIVKAIRRREVLKHTLRVSIKWLLRAIGIILVYNGNASPLVSMGLVSLCILLYLYFTVYKWIANKINRRLSKKKNK